MVYDGRPSTGCQTCRKRRIKCDEGRPICGQCTKSRRECLGYIDKHDLFFRDETIVTENRARRAKERQKEKDSDVQQDLELVKHSKTSSKLSRMSSSSPTSICATISEPLADKAVNFFFANLIFSPRHPGVSRGLFDFLPELYTKASDTSSLAYATKATALAAFGNVAGDKDRSSPLAWRVYGSAISELNTALADPLMARRNETLMTILLFCMAETLLGNTQQTHKTQKPISHIDGAVSLLKLRGRELLESEMSARLFLAVRTHMMIERMQQGKALDEFFYSPTTGWQHEVAPALQNPANQLTQYTLLVPALRSRATDLLQQSKTNWNIYAVGMLLLEVRQVDVILSTWPACIPESWQHISTSHAVWNSTTHLPTCYPYQIYPGALDSYYDIWIAAVWNNYRCARLFLNAIIIRCVQYVSAPPSPAHEDSRYILAMGTMQTMADEICASVSFFLGYNEKSLPRELEIRSLTDSPEYTFMAVRPAQPSTISGYFLLWPLFVARSALPIPLSQRNYLRGRMKDVADSFGLQQAAVLVEVGDKDEKRPLFSESWEKSAAERNWEHANLYASSGI